MDEEYPIPDMGTTSRNLHGPHTVANLISQTPISKLNLKKAKYKCTINTSQYCSRCVDYLRDWKTLLQSSIIASNQRCRDLSRRYFGPLSYQGSVRKENACIQGSTT